MISIVLPCHDEEDNLAPLLEELEAVMPGAEILFVDDGSRDGSLARMRELARGRPHVRVLRLDGQYGKSAALSAGIRASRGEVLVLLDADLQYDPRDIPRMVSLLDRFDGVSGRRARRADSWVRRVSSSVGNAVRRWILHDRVRDGASGLQALRRSAAERVRLYDGMHRFLPVLLAIEGLTMVEVDIAHRPRRHGEAKVGVLNRLAGPLADALAVRWMKARSPRCRVVEEPPA